MTSGFERSWRGQWGIVGRYPMEEMPNSLSCRER